MDIGKPSLDHLSVFLAVVDAGSFNGAARRMGRAISAISYAIATLEAQLGVTLFDREGSRRPVLTAAGRAILGAARAVSNEVDGLISGVRALNAGMESELTLAVDTMMPQALLACVLRDFDLTFPTVDLRLHVEGLGAVAALVIAGQAEIGLSGPMIADHPDLHLQTVGELELIPVAAPTHPLARAVTILPGMVRRYRQLVLSDRSSLTAGEDYAVYAARTWRLGDLGAKHALLREGIGWGNMPAHMVARDLAAGRLVRLPVPEAPLTRYALRTVWRRDSACGPAHGWLAERLASALASEAGGGSLSAPGPKG